MSTPTAAPPIVTTGRDTAAASPRRRRRWPLFVIFGLFDVMAILAGSFLANYQPLSHGSESGVSVQVKHIQGFDEPETWVVPYLDKHTFVFALTIRNEGHVGVTVTSVGGGDDPHAVSLITYDGAFIGPSEQSGMPGYDLNTLSPLRPFALAPGHERLVWLRYRLDNCRFNDYGGATGITSLPVTYRVFGIPRHGQMNLHTFIEVKSPKDCPGRPESP